MKVTRKQIFNVLISLMISVFFTIYCFMSSNQFSFLLGSEIFILSFFFCCVAFGSDDRFSPFSFFLLSLFLGVIDIILVFLKVRLVNAYYPINVYEQSLLIIIIWLFFFVISYFLSKNKQKKISFSINKIVDKLFSNSRLNILLFLATLVFIYITYTILKTIQAVGGISAAMNNFTVFRHNNQGYLTVILPICAIIPIVLYEMKRKKTSIISMIVIFILICLTGRRGLALNTIVIPFLVYYNYRVKKIANKVILILLTPIIAFILFMGSMRNQTMSSSSSNVILNLAAKISNTIQYGQNIPDLLVAMDSGKVKLQGNKYILNGVLGIVPRSIWPQKGESDHSLITSRLVYYSDITYGKPVGAFGFSYLCYGFLGTVVSGIICGILTSIFYHWMRKNNSIIAIILYSILIQNILYVTNPDAQVRVLTLMVVFVLFSILSNFSRLIRGEK